MSVYRGVPFLITGAEGFIGSNLAAALSRRGARLGLLVHPRASLDRLERLRGRFEVFPVDIRARAKVFEAVKSFQPRKVFHLAAFSNPERDWKHLNRALAVNLGGTVNLVHALEGSGYDTLVTVCTAEVYGRNRPPFSEDTPVDPISPYSFSKAAAAAFCRMSAVSFKARISIARFFLVYGPGQGREKFLPQLIEAAIRQKPFAMTAGAQSRELLYIDDAVRGLLVVADKGRRDGRIYNLGSGEEITLRSLVGRVEEATGKKLKLTRPFLPYRPGEIRRLIGDHHRARQELGWRPVFKLSDGLSRIIDGLKK